MRKIFILFCILYVQNLFPSNLYHHDLLDQKKNQDTYIWEEQAVPSFNEVVLSWNLHKPKKKGYFEIYISLYTENKGWSPDIFYARWGNQDYQISSSKKLPDFSIEITENIFITASNNLGIGFRITIQAIDGAVFDFNDSCLHVCTINTTEKTSTSFEPINHSIFLPLPYLSQIKLYCEDSQSRNPDSNLQTAIYENWILDIAQSFKELNVFQYWVTKLTGLDDIIDSLRKDLPIFINVEGLSLNGTPIYSSGHWLVIVGYNHKKNEFLCMYPCFMIHTSYPVCYSAEQLQQAWEKKQYLAYIFKKK